MGAPPLVSGIRTMRITRTSRPCGIVKISPWRMIAWARSIRRPLSRTWPFSAIRLAIARLWQKRRNHKSLSILSPCLSSATRPARFPFKPASYFFILSFSAANSAKAPPAVANTGSGLRAAGFCRNLGLPPVFFPVLLCWLSRLGRPIPFQRQ